jgi:hypothetical protein
MACEPPLTCCGHLIPDFAGCVDTRVNILHCGECNHPCGGFPPLCIFGTCAAGG